MAPEKHTKIENSFCRGGVFIINATNQEAKEWPVDNGAELARESDTFGLEGVELLQHFKKATALFPFPPVEPAAILNLPENVNLTLKIKILVALRTSENEEKLQREENNLLVVMQILEKQVQTLQARNYRPYYYLGRVTFKGNPGSDGEKK